MSKATGYLSPVDLALLKPGIYTGYNPDTNRIHRLTIRADEKVEIERVGFPKLIEEARNHLFLINRIKQNPCEWHE